MNILITRPLIDSEDLMGKLFSLGHRIVHIPTLKISASNVNPVEELILTLEHQRNYETHVKFIDLAKQMDEGGASLMRVPE